MMPTATKASAITPLQAVLTRIDAVSSMNNTPAKSRVHPLLPETDSHDEKELRQRLARIVVLFGNLPEEHHELLKLVAISVDAIPNHSHQDARDWFSLGQGDDCALQRGDLVGVVGGFEPFEDPFSRRALVTLRDPYQKRALRLERSHEAKYGAKGSARRTRRHPAEALAFAARSIHHFRGNFIHPFCRIANTGRHKMTENGPKFAIDPQYSAYVANTAVHGTLLGLAAGFYSGIDDMVHRRWPPTLVEAGAVRHSQALVGWPSSTPARLSIVTRGAGLMAMNAARLTFVYSAAAGGVQSLRGGDWDGLDLAIGLFAVGMLQGNGIPLAHRFAWSAGLGLMGGAGKTVLYIQSGRLRWNGPGSGRW